MWLGCQMSSAFADSLISLPVKAKKSIILALTIGLLVLPTLWGADEELEFMVLGVIASTKTNAGFALLKHKTTGKVLTLKEGSEVDKKIQILKVERQLVRFKKGDKEFVVDVGSDVPQSKSSVAGAPKPVNLGNGLEKNGDELRVTSALKEKLVNEDLQTVLMQAAVEPFLENGAVKGFKIWDIEPNSIYEKAGLQNGDLITHINGIALKDAASAINTLKNLKNATEVDVTFVNGGAEKTLKIVVQ